MKILKKIYEQVTSNRADLINQYKIFGNIMDPFDFVNYTNINLYPSVVRENYIKTVDIIKNSNYELKSYNVKHLSSEFSIYVKDDSKQSILVVFTGNAQRPMLPLPVFLQYLPNSIGTVLVLRDYSNHLFLNGISPYGNFLELIEQIKKITINFDKVFSLGTSSGGAASIYSNFIIDYHKIICIGGRHPTLSRFNNNSLSFNANFFDYLIKSNPSKINQKAINIIFASALKGDLEGAESLYKIFPDSNLMPIVDCNEHSVLNFFLKNSYLIKFNNEIFI